MIRALTGPDLGVPRIDECMLVEWTEADARVVFSFAKLGNGMTMHFAAGPESLRELKTAIEDFIEWTFWAFEWCELIFGIIGPQSVERLATKCGFKYLCPKGPYQVYVRMRK